MAFKLDPKDNLFGIVRKAEYVCRDGERFIEVTVEMAAPCQDPPVGKIVVLVNPRNFGGIIDDSGRTAKNDGSQKEETRAS